MNSAVASAVQKEGGEERLKEDDHSNHGSEKSSSTSAAIPSVGAGEGRYVHKLKKAWIKSYNQGEEGTQSNNESPCPSNPATPLGSSTGARATPSPAPSHQSSASSSATREKGAMQMSGSKRKALSINGHSSKSKKKEREESFSSTSESEDGRASRSRRRGGGIKAQSSNKELRIGGRQQPSRKVRRQQSGEESRSEESEKEVDSDGGKDSDLSSATTGSSRKSSGQPGSRRRGRKPNKSKTKSPSSPASDDHSSSNGGVRVRVSGGPFRRPPTSQLKRTGESFLQDASCFDVAPKLSKCRECRWTQSQRNKKMPNIFCRFYAFRRLRYTKGGQLAVAGFCDPSADATKTDLELWTPSAEKSKVGDDVMTPAQARFLLETLKEDFNGIMQKEREALKAHAGEGEIE